MDYSLDEIGYKEDLLLSQKISELNPESAHFETAIVKYGIAGRKRTYIQLLLGFCSYKILTGNTPEAKVAKSEFPLLEDVDKSTIKSKKDIIRLLVKIVENEEVANDILTGFIDSGRAFALSDLPDA